MVFYKSNKTLRINFLLIDEGNLTQTVTFGVLYNRYRLSV